jgi:hypothetical protein
LFLADGLYAVALWRGCRGARSGLPCPVLVCCRRGRLAGPGETSTILVLHIIGARPSKQPLIVRTFLKVYMELGSYFLFLQDQIKDIIITGGWVRFSKTTRKERRRTLIRTWDKDMLTPSKN